MRRALAWILVALLAATGALLLLLRQTAPQPSAAPDATQVRPMADGIEPRPVDAPGLVADGDRSDTARFAVGANAAVGSGATATLDVRVLCCELPLAGAELRFEPASFSDDMRAQSIGRTDAVGRVRVDGLEPGEILLRVDRGSRRSVLLRAGETTDVVFELRGGTVRGTVTSRAGIPIAGATARLAGMERTRTDQRGKFELTCAPRSSRLDVWADGYACSETYTIPLIGSSGMELAIVLDEAASALSGTVVGPRGEPLDGARVRLEVGVRSRTVIERGWMRTAGVSVDTQTDASGSFHFRGLLPGAARVSARSPGFVPVTQELALAASQESTVVLAVAAGGVVEGIVRSSADEPVAGAYVGTHSLFGPLAVVTRSRMDGSYRLTGVPIGVDVEVDAEDPAAGRAEQTLRLAEGTLGRWDPVLTAGNVVSGVIVDEVGAALPGLFVGFFTGGQESAWHASDESDAAGRFRLTQLPSGPGQVLVRSEGHTVLPAIVKRDVVVPCSEELVLVASRASLPSAWIVGVVTDRSGAPLDQAEVLAGLVGAGRTTGFPVSVGTARFRVGPLPPGEWRVRVQAADRGRSDLGTLALKAGAELDLGPVVLDDPGWVRLEFRSPGNPVQLGSRMISVQDRNGLGWDATSSTGSEFLLGPLQPGRHRVSVDGSELEADVLSGQTTTLVVE